MKTSELIGGSLDYWVARAQGVDLGREWDQGAEYVMAGGHSGRSMYRYHPSSNWAQGGPIIGDQKMYLEWDADGYWVAHSLGGATVPGPTALIAAMRAHVVSIFGEEVQL